MVSVLLKKNNRRQVSAKKKISFVSIQNRMMDNYLITNFTVWKEERIMGEEVFIVIVIVVAIIIWLICRELNCWYWKINKRISQLEEMNTNLEHMNKTLEHIVSCLRETPKRQETLPPPQG